MCELGEQCQYGPPEDRRRDLGAPSSAPVGPSATEGAKGPQILDGLADEIDADGQRLQEVLDVLLRFWGELAKATGDGSRKRQAGEKPPWYRDDSHEGAIFSHLTKWKRGEMVDPDSGAHPLVHAAWRCLAIACRESGNTP